MSISACQALGPEAAMFRTAACPFAHCSCDSLDENGQGADPPRRRVAPSCGLCAGVAEPFLLPDCPNLRRAGASLHDGEITGDAVRTHIEWIPLACFAVNGGVGLEVSGVELRVIR